MNLSLEYFTNLCYYNNRKRGKNKIKAKYEMLELITEFKVNILKKGINNLTKIDEQLINFYNLLYGKVERGEIEL